MEILTPLPPLLQFSSKHPLNLILCPNSVKNQDSRSGFYCELIIRDTYLQQKHIGEKTDQFPHIPCKFFMPALIDQQD